MPINQLSTSNTFQQWLIATQVLIEKSNYYDDRTNLVFQTANNVSNSEIAVYANAVIVNAQTAIVNAQTTLVLATAANVYATYGNTINTYNDTVTVLGYVNSNLTIALDTSNSIISVAQNTSNSVLAAAQLAANSIYIDYQDAANNILISYQNTANGVLSASQNLANSINSDSLNTANIIVNSANAFANIVNLTSQNAYNTANIALLTAQDAQNLVYEITDDNLSNTTLYLTMLSANVGFANTAYVSSEKLYYNPSTGQLSATNFDSLSDVNKKTDIETIQNALKLVMSLRGVTFKWKDNGHKSMGLIAQELEEIVPEVVMTNEHGEKSVTYGSLIGLLVEAIKDLNKQVTEIKTIINKE